MPTAIFDQWRELAPIRRQRLADALELRLRDNFAVDGILDGRGFGS